MTLPVACTRHHVWLAACPVCTAHHLARLKEKTP